MTFGDLITCTSERWAPGIGDPTVWGWFTVLCYVGASAGCAYAASRTDRTSGWRRRHLFWVLLSGALLALAVNKQLDLQSALTAGARCLAKAQGWYNDRRGIQLAFIAGVVGIAIVGALAAAFLMRKEVRAVWPAVVGVGLLCAFIAVRAAGFHHVDAMLQRGAVGITFNAFAEIGGVFLIAWGAARAVRMSAPRHSL